MSKIYQNIISILIVFALAAIVFSSASFAQARKKTAPKRKSNAAGNKTAAANAGQTDARFNQSFDDGVRCLKEKNYDCANENFTQALSFNADAKFALSKSDRDYFVSRLETLVFCVSGETDAGIDEATFVFNCFAPETKKNRAAAFFNRGLAWFVGGDYESATADFSGALKLIPDYNQALLMLGWSHRAAANFGAAIRVLTRLIALNRFDKQLYLLRGNNYFLQGEYRSAITDYTKAIRLDETNGGIKCFGTAYKNRGAAYEKLGKTALAAKDFKAATEFSCGGTSAP